MSRYSELPPKREVNGGQEEDTDFLRNTYVEPKKEKADVSPTRTFNRKDFLDEPDEILDNDRKSELTQAVRLHSYSVSIQENYKRLVQDELLAKERKHWMMYEKGLIKSLTIHFKPLYTRFEKNNNESFIKAVFEFIGMDEKQLEHLSNSEEGEHSDNIMLQIINVVQEFREASVEMLAYNTEKLDFFLLLLAGHLTLLTGKYLIYQKLEEEFEKELKYLAKGSTVDERVKGSYNQKQPVDPSLSFNVTMAKFYEGTPYTNTFCVVKANEIAICKTPVIRNTKEPRYDYFSAFKLKDDFDSVTEIVVELYDADTEKLIGSCPVTFEEIIENTFVTENYRLRALLSKGKTELLASEQQARDSVRPFSMLSPKAMLSNMSVRKETSIYDVLLEQENAAANFGELHLEFKIVLNDKSRDLVARCRTNRIESLKQMIIHNKGNLSEREKKIREVTENVSGLQWNEKMGLTYSSTLKPRERSACMCAFGEDRELCNIF